MGAAVSHRTRIASENTFTLLDIFLRYFSVLAIVKKIVEISQKNATELLLLHFETSWILLETALFD